MLPLDTELYRMTATEITRHLKSEDFTVEDYVRSLLCRVEARDPIVKAWAYINPALIIDQARKLDKIPPQERGPLYGIPIAVKDVIYTQDMPTQHNSPIYEGSKVRMGAAAISILRKAGAIIFAARLALGKTTTAEFAAIGVGPETRNPHDPERTPGGSSSGSGAAVADMHVPLALGTQTGGSIVRPASFNGIFAMKPTWGAISTEGQKVFSGIFDTIGFFARSVDDLQLLADVFQLRDDDPPRAVEIGGSRLAILKTVQWKHAQRGTIEALETAARLLRLQGGVVEEVDLPSDFDDLHLWHKQTMNTDGAVTFYKEYYATKDKLPEGIVDYVENKHGYTHKDRLDAMDNIARLRPQVDEILRRYTAVITPSAPGEAPVSQNTGSPVFNTFWTVGE